MTVGTARIVVRAGTAHTGGALTVLDYFMPPAYPGPPVHVHPAFDEVFAVIEGRLTMRLGEETLVAAQGDSVVVPGAVPHTFTNREDVPARVVIAATPAGFEPYFDELAEHLAQGAPDPAFIAALTARYGVENVGPPIPVAEP